MQALYNMRGKRRISKHLHAVAFLANNEYRGVKDHITQHEKTQHNVMLCFPTCGLKEKNIRL